LLLLGTLVLVCGAAGESCSAAPDDGAVMMPTTAPSAVPTSMPQMTGDMGGMGGMTMPMTKTMPATAPSVFHARGQVVNAVPESKAGQGASMLVDHEDIPGFMSAMRMHFHLADPADAAPLHPGDKIAFEVIEQANGDYAASHVRALPPDTTLKLATETASHSATTQP
jgi:Cu/Ag efflux protein CusF